MIQLVQQQLGWFGLEDREPGRADLDQLRGQGTAQPRGCPAGVAERSRPVLRPPSDVRR
jgi:hypothetical protein